LCEQQSLLLVQPVFGPDGEHLHLPPEHVNEVQSAPYPHGPPTGLWPQDWMPELWL
jgi:hypothetical protein